MLEAFSRSYNILAFKQLCFQHHRSCYDDRKHGFKDKNQSIENVKRFGTSQSVKTHIHTAPVQTEKVSLSKRIMTCILILIYCVSCVSV